VWGVGIGLRHGRRFGVGIALVRHDLDLFLSFSLFVILEMGRLGVVLLEVVLKTRGCVRRFKG